MKLINAQVTEFRSINDSNQFEIGDVTCLVGKNESGKTALLKALYKLNPIIEEDGIFDVTDDYPRRDVSDYEYEIESGERSPATVIRATYELEDADILTVENTFGKNCFTSKKPTVSLSKGYENVSNFDGLEVNTIESLRHLVKSYDLASTVGSELHKRETAQAMCDVLQSAEATEATQQLLKQLDPIAKNGLTHVVYNDIIRNRMPKFLYFDEYYQMKGQDNIEALQKRVASQTLKESDHPLLGLIELARLDLTQLTDPNVQNPCCLS